jgi:hypothetical protein
MERRQAYGSNVEIPAIIRETKGLEAFGIEYQRRIRSGTASAQDMEQTAKGAVYAVQAECPAWSRDHCTRSAMK